MTGRGWAGAGWPRPIVACGQAVDAAVDNGRPMLWTTCGDGPGLWMRLGILWTTGRVNGGTLWTGSSVIHILSTGLWVTRPLLQRSSSLACGLRRISTGVVDNPVDNFGGCGELICDASPHPLAI